MKRATILMAVMTLIFLTSASGFSFSPPPQEVSITLDGRINYPYMSHRGGASYLQINLSTSDYRPIERRRMNVSVVLDRSGSMADQGKIEYAKSALHKLIDQLSSDDILSIVIYDDVVEVLRKAERVGSKSSIRRLVDEVYPRNSTNLGGGMIEGFRQVERFRRKGFTNRVILLSDGLANRGITDPHELSRIARKYRSKSISLSTMGVGLDYNENLMVGLSESGGGNYYFIESPSMLASIMHQELNTISTLVAQNVVIELKLGRGVRIRELIGCDYRAEGDRYFIHVGDLSANEAREITVGLEIPEGSGQITAVRGSLNYEGTGVTVDRARGFSTIINYTRDTAMIEKNLDIETQGRADVAVSTRKVENALKALDEGRQEEAQRELDDARMFIANSPAASVGGELGKAIREQEAKLEGYADTLEANKDDVRRAKKSIQYDNYRTQKKK